MKPKWTSIASILVALAGVGIATLAGSEVIKYTHHQPRPETAAATPLSSTVNAADPGSGNISVPSNGNSQSNTSVNVGGTSTLSINRLQNGAGANTGPHSSTATMSQGSQTTSQASQPPSSGGLKGTQTVQSQYTTGRGSNSGSSPSPSPPSQVLGSGNGPFDDSVKPGYDSRAEVFASFGEAVGITPDMSGPSPFRDLPSSDPHWGIIHAMIHRGMIRGISDTYFGANINYRIRDLPGLYLSYANIHIYPSEYNPGYNQSPLVWGQTVGLLSGVVGGYPTSAYQALGPGDGLCVRPGDLANFLDDVKSFLQGYRKASQGYDELVYPIQDEAQTFQGTHPTEGYQASIKMTYKTMNDILVKQSGNDLILSLPAFAENSEWHFIVGNKVQFSINNGWTWQTAKNPASNLFSFYQSATSSYGGLPAGKLPARVLVKSPIGADLWIRFYDGTSLVADENVGWSNGAPTIQRNDVSSQLGP